ncbi:MAG: kinase [Verrucomicrobiales bacterium]|nr:kinase [Verrucomicrobiales bacterium]
MIISRAPLRISFFGGGTDYPEFFQHEPGTVLATAIDKYSYVTASPFMSHLFDYSIRVSYRKVELAKCAEEIEHKVYRECLKLCGLEKDIELHAMADLPAFTGLGSSSTFTVALLHALHSFRGKFRTPAELAYEAIHVERAILSETVGCQDQVMAAFGGFNIVEFRKEDDISVQRLQISAQRLAQLEEHLILVFTGITRQASAVAAHQVQKVRQNLPALRQMKSMVEEGANILTNQRPLSQFGELLHRAWTAKRSLDNGISNQEIDSIYARGRDAGALGGKLLGAGGGGFMLFFVPPEKVEHLKAAFPEKPALRVKLDAPGTRIIFS